MIHRVRPRSLEALGFAGVPLHEPLLYPGRLVEGPALLSDARLLELGAVHDRLGAWPVHPHPQDADGGHVAVTLDALLDGLGLPLTGDRHPVLAVGSNGSPGQLSHKLRAAGLSDTVPMVPLRVRGVAVALSGHISRAGYVSASPYLAPGTQTPLIATWLDPAQLAAVDATEMPNYHRVFLPGDAFPMTMPSGRRLGGAYLYDNARGLLRTPGGRGPRPGGEQSAVLAGLLADSPTLRELLGPAPHDWVRRTRADATLPARGTALFEAEGWLLPDTGLAPYTVEPGEEIRYRDLAA